MVDTGELKPPSANSSTKSRDSRNDRTVVEEELKLMKATVYKEEFLEAAANEKRGKKAKKSKVGTFVEKALLAIPDSDVGGANLGGS